MAVARALLLSVASASSLAIRSRVPLSQPLRAASVRMMAGAADDPAAFVKSTVASDKVTRSHRRRSRRPSRRPRRFPHRSRAAPAPTAHRLYAARISLRHACLRISPCAGGGLLEDDLPVLPQDQGPVRRPRCEVHRGGAGRLQPSPQALTLTLTLALTLPLSLTAARTLALTRSLASRARRDGGPHLCLP